jgi:LmbE family N-acetylglucosaminyl deacetylase
MVFNCKLIRFFLIFFLIVGPVLFAQNEVATSTHIYKALKKLNVLGSILYIAAHPDDENTSVLSYMDQGELYRAGYLSLTRGDGGQNLLGTEKGPLLGVLRTQELLSARRIDGAEQFFTRAIDFGYSKTADETLRNWDRELLLGDVVKVIRLFKPDIIVTRFSKTQGGHGHHLVSAILAEEAFRTTADPEKYPDQLTHLEVWQAKRLFWNTWSPSEKAISINIGKYDPLLGKSYHEYAAASRSMHKSQGFGVSPRRGEQYIWFDLTAGEIAGEGLFEGIDVTWNRIENSQLISEKIQFLIESFEPEYPQNSVADLIDLYKLLDDHSDNYWIRVKQSEVKKLIQMCSGIWIESVVGKPGASPGMTVDVKPMILNRSALPILVKYIETTYHRSDSLLLQPLQKNIPFSQKYEITLPADAPYTQPFWLQLPNNGKMYSYEDTSTIYQADSSPALTTTFLIEINGLPLEYKVPVIYRWNDAKKGELSRPFIIRPIVDMAIDKQTYIFTGSKSHDIEFRITSHGTNIEGKVQLEIPESWTSYPDEHTFNLSAPGDQIERRFLVQAGTAAQSGIAKLKSTTPDGKEYNHTIIEIDYDHIQPQTVLQPAQTYLVHLDITIPTKKIGYIMGSGDEIPEALTQLGYQVKLLSDKDLAQASLSDYDAIICGVRAFNTRKELNLHQKRFIKYVEDGGTWIVQHNTRFGFKVDKIGPYYFSTSGRDRISDENAPLQILQPNHRIFNYPNKISEKDFENWVQERGLYFADSWDDNFIPLLSGNDQGESAKRGGLLYATYGKGVFIFTGYSWFRQLPAGVPGAYRIFVNMISARSEK